MKKLLISIAILITLLVSTSKAEYFKDVIITSPAGIWTDERAYNTLSEAISAIGSAEQTLLISRQVACDSLTIPTNIKLHFVKDGSINNSGTLILETKDITAGDHQIFTGSGPINFAKGSELRSTWFSDFSTAAIATASSAVALIISKDETVYTSCAIGDGVVLKWNSPNTLSAALGVTISNIGSIEAGKYQIFTGAGDFDFNQGSILKSSWFSSLSAVDTFTDDDNVDLIIEIDRPEVASLNITFDRHQGLKVNKGCPITINDGVVLTQEGPLEAGLYKIFNYVGTGKVILGPRVLQSHPDWWGNNDEPGVTDMSDAINACAAASKINLVPVKFGPSIYYVTKSLDFTEANQTVVFPREGWDISGTGYKSTIIKPELSEAYPVLDIVGSASCHVHDLGVYSYSDVGLQTAGILMGTSTTRQSGDAKIENVLVRGYFNGGACLVASCGDLYHIKGSTFHGIDCSAAVFTTEDTSGGVSYMSAIVKSKFATLQPEGNTLIKTSDCIFTSNSSDVTVDYYYANWIDRGSYWACTGTSSKALHFFGRPGTGSLTFEGIRMETNHSTVDTAGIYIDPAHSRLSHSFISGYIGVDTPVSKAICSEGTAIDSSYLQVTKNSDIDAPLLSGDIVNSIVFVRAFNYQYIANYTQSSRGNIVFTGRNATNLASWRNVASKVYSEENTYTMSDQINRRVAIGSSKTDFGIQSGVILRHGIDKAVNDGNPDCVLATYTLPKFSAPTVAAEKSLIHVIASGRFTSNTNVKDLRLYGKWYNASTGVVYDYKLVENNITTAPKGLVWFIDVYISNFYESVSRMQVGTDNQTVKQQRFHAGGSEGFEFGVDTLTIELRTSAAAGDVYTDIFTVSLGS